MSKRKTYVFDDFRGGFVSTTAWPRGVRMGQYTGLNMQPCRDGSITVRKGVREITPSGLPNGSLFGFYTVPGLSNNLIFIIGNSVYRGTISGSSSLLGTLAKTPTNTVPGVRIGFAVYITVKGDKCYRIDPLNNQLTALTDTPGGDCLFLKGGRLHVVDGNHLMWSKLNDFSDFSIDDSDENSGGDTYIGTDHLDVVAALPIRDHVLLCKNAEGTWVLTGSNPEDYQLRKVTEFDGPTHWSHIARWQGAGLYHRTSGAGQAPVLLDGTAPRPLHHLAGAVQSGVVLAPQIDFGMVSSEGDQTLIINDGTDRKMLLYSSPGTWSLHSFPTLPALRGSVMVMDGQDGIVYLTTAGGVSSSPKLYRWQCDLGPAGTQERPGFESDTNARAGDASATPVTGDLWLPEIAEDDGSTIRPVEVVVDFLSYPTGGSSPNQIKCSVVCTEAPLQSSNTLSMSTPAVWTESVTPVAGGSRRQVRFGVGDQAAGMAWGVLLSELRGVRIMRVRVVCDLSRPTAR